MFEATDEWLDHVFAEEVVPDLFSGAQRGFVPVAVLLGGQPGAGKTRAARIAQGAFGHGLVAITGDDFRVMHPDYKWLQKHDPVGMPNITAAVSGPMVERCIQYAKERGYSVLVEGTFRSAQTSLATAKAFVEGGYSVHATALAVPPALSRMSAVARFYETLDHGENRWTPLSAHEVAVKAMPGTVSGLGESSDIAVLTLVDRAGKSLFASDIPGKRRAQQAVKVLEEQHSRSLTPEERHQWEQTFAASQQVAKTHPVAQGMAGEESVGSAWALLEADLSHLARSQ